MPAEVWETQRDGPRYRPEAFEREGFVHCTDGLAHLLVPANTYYRDDPRPYLALEIDLDAVAAPARFDDEACRYPHIYGPVDVARGAPGAAGGTGRGRHLHGFRHGLNHLGTPRVG